jgi:hypothetical protein
MKEYVYSANNIDYMDLEDILEEIKYEPEIKEIYKGVKISFQHSDFFNASEVIENITESAYGTVDEYSDNYCDELEDKKHEENISSLILDYLNKNVSQPGFFQVEDVKKINISELNINDN